MMGRRALVTQEQWLDRGLEAFGRAGRAGLKVESLAAALGCSKAGFYWYFGSKAVFEGRVVEHWRRRETLSLIEAAERAASPREKLQSLFERVLRLPRSGDFLFHLRALARKSARLRAVLEDVERTRLEYVARVLVDLGQPEGRARERAEVLYHYYLGWYERHKHERLSKAELAKQIAVAARIVGLAPLEPASEVKR